MNYSMEHYLEWEENEFLRSLRIELVPETKDGDFRSIVNSSEMKLINQRLLPAVAPANQCRRRNQTLENYDVDSQLREKVHAYTSFEDYLINM
uniref:Uncharacterized protein n=1 Tax=Heterorhabditis bacteriophora TaxID=37862 RepID=A0A1I7XUF9_HETBA